MIRVYHNDNFLDYTLGGKTLGETIVRLAAGVDTDDLEKAFELTNNIDAPWIKNHSVIATGLSERSTSVGDILEKDSKKFVVESCGFRELTPQEDARIKWHVVRKEFLYG